jgi:hypothetical protein
LGSSCILCRKVTTPGGRRSAQASDGRQQHNSNNALFIASPFVPILASAFRRQTDFKQQRHRVGEKLPAIAFLDEDDAGKTSPCGRHEPAPLRRLNGIMRAQSSQHYGFDWLAKRLLPFSIGR